MRRLIYFILAFVVWFLLNWPFAGGKIDTQVIIVGLVASIVVTIMFSEVLPKEHRFFLSPVRIFSQYSGLMDRITFIQTPHFDNFVICFMS